MPPPKTSGPRGKAPKKPSMMEQFWAAKKEHPGCVLFFRMGDFYELFHEDAQLASKELGITLTARSKDKDAIPMAGVPVRSLETHLFRLVNKGHKVAICEQTGDPRKTKGIVDRAVVRVVTKGTITEEDALDARAPNHLCCLHATADGLVGVAWVDVSTGRFRVANLPLEKLSDELARIRPAEAVVAPELFETLPRLHDELRRELGAALSEREAWRFEPRATRKALERQFRVASLAGFGLDEDSPAVNAAGCLVEYLEETQKSACAHILRLEVVQAAQHLVLDRATQGTLELTRTQREGRSEGTLLDALDSTRTAMGGRLLREWVLAPLLDVEAIRRRQQGVAELHESPFLRDDLRELLGGILDVERLVAKISTGRANARDLVALAGSLEAVPGLRGKLENVYSALLDELRTELDPLEDVVQRIRATLVEEPPPTLKEGGLVRRGFHPELDELAEISGDGKTWIARFQAEEIERTGIQGLKIGFNSVFGYFLDVPRGQIDRVPEHYVRKQTIKNSERYVTSELKEFEDKVLRAEERAKDLEYDLFLELRDEVAAEVRRILDTARAIADVDVLCGLAQVAHEHRYVRPEVSQDETIEIVAGRHPVLERLESVDSFVPNDSLLDHGSHRLTVLTGPNMAGKSTYIRQTALIVLLAQIGSFVPAREARIGVVDRIFTRIGSADDIGRGESTFMVEMVEIANILNNATERSLVVLDEVGRGTSTFDGLALAWAICEELHDRIGARTLFATHYHQLTDLAERLGGVCNKSVAVREWEDDIVFLHQIVEGGTDRSYGIHVARLAGAPQSLLGRAREILRELEGSEVEVSGRVAAESTDAPKLNVPPLEETATAAPPPAAAAHGGGQLSLFGSGPSAVERELAALDLDQMTPIEALLALQKLKSRLS